MKMTREEAIYLLKNTAWLAPSLEPIDEAIDMAIEALENERSKGHWIKISPANIYECSVCHRNVMTQDIDAYQFCHHCGADMRGESE